MTRALTIMWPILECFCQREQQWSTIKKECLAIKLGVQTFQMFLLGQSFTIQPDHHALQWLCSRGHNSISNMVEPFTLAFPVLSRATSQCQCRRTLSRMNCKWRIKRFSAGEVEGSAWDWLSGYCITHALLYIGCSLFPLCRRMNFPL